MEGRADPISLDLSHYSWGPTSTTAVDWHLKIEDVGCDVGLTKNYCLTVSIAELINSFFRYSRF